MGPVLHACHTWETACHYIVMYILLLSGFFNASGLGNVLYRYYWVRITPRHASPRSTRWRKQCLESRSEKATRTRYQVRVTFSIYSAGQKFDSSQGSTRLLGLRPSALVDPWLEPHVWCKPRALFLKRYKPLQIWLYVTCEQNFWIPSREWTLLLFDVL